MVPPVPATDGLEICLLAFWTLEREVRGFDGGARALGAGCVDRESEADEVRFASRAVPMVDFCVVLGASGSGGAAVLVLGSGSLDAPKRGMPDALDGCCWSRCWTESMFAARAPRLV